MYRVFFTFIFIGFWCVYGQRVQSPCPDYFEYASDGSGTYGIITLQPFGPVSSVAIRGNFTVAAIWESNYSGKIRPLSSNTHALQDFNRGVPLRYRVNFPVTSPLPKITSLTVNDNVVCFSTADIPEEARDVTEISLRHKWSLAYPERAPKPPQTTSSPQLVYTRPTTERTRPTPPRVNKYTPPPKQFIPSSTSTSSNAMECGVNSSPSVALIIKGFSYERGEWPWLVAIYKKKKFSSLSYICAGTLISDTHVVSAAHCMQQRSSYTSVKKLVVRAGVYNLEDWTDDVTVTRTLQSAAIHEAYNASTLANDLLILTLEKPVTFGTYIKPACLWSGNPDLNRIVGTTGVVAGWGTTESGPGGTGKPRMVRMPIVSTETCRGSKAAFHELTSTNTLCAGDHSGSGPCFGDSGGGLYVLDNDRWRLRGVVSLSLRSNNADSICNVDDYIVFTDTAQFLPWIEQVMSEASR